MILMEQAVEAIVEQSRHNENKVNAVTKTAVAPENNEGRCHEVQVCSRPKFGLP